MSFGIQLTPGLRKLLMFGLFGAFGGLMAPLLLGEWLLRATLPPPATPQKVDVLFVLDVTGSMQGEIDGVSRGIQRFATALTQKELDTQVGMLTFRDRLAGEEPETLTFSGAPFTSDYAAFGEKVGELRAEGGGDEPESSLDTLSTAARQPFRPDATKVVLLITDAPPQVPDKETSSIEDAARALLHAGVDQLHLVIQDGDRLAYAGLQTGVPGQIFSLADAAAERQGFDQILPTVGEQIADAALVQSRTSTTADANSADRFMRLMLATSLWTATLALGVFLALVLGQHIYLRGGRTPWRQLAAGTFGSVLAGVTAGVAGQLLYAGAQSVPAIEVVGRLGGWSILGGLLGAGIAFFIPNLPHPRAVLGGTLGGAAGAVGFLAAAGVLGDLFGRLFGGALVGFFIGVMLVLVEIAFRPAWLEISYGPNEVRSVSLGPEPVAIGSDPGACTIFAAGAPPIGWRYRVEQGAVLCEDVPASRTVRVRPGDRKTVGGLTVTVCASGRGETSVAGPANGSQGSGAGPVSGFVLRLSTGGTIDLREGAEVPRKAIVGLSPASPGGSVAAVVGHPHDASVLGLRNLSQQTWTATLAGGDWRQVEPGKSIKLAAGTTLDFGVTTGEII